MKCDHCEREATVHEVTIKNSVKVERHLCEHCAGKQGYVVTAHNPVQDVVATFITSQATGQKPANPKTERGKPRVSCCGSCGLSYAEFRSKGVLGCPTCYDEFEAQLSPLLQRAHEGGTHHVGKIPTQRVQARLEDDQSEQFRQECEQRCEALQRQLTVAVDSEQYEVAGKLHQQIEELRLMIESPQPDASEARTPEDAAGAGA